MADRGSERILILNTSVARHQSTILKGIWHCGYLRAYSFSGELVRKAVIEQILTPIQAE